MNGYRITEARQDDLAAIVDIYNSTIYSRLATADLSPATVESRQSWLDAHGGNRPLYVLKNQEGELLAWGGFSDYYPREAYRITAEISIYAAPEPCGKGLGGRLVNFMLERAPELGVKNVVALIFSSNAASLNLFAKLGFARWGELPGVCDMGGKIESLTILGKKLG